MNLAPVLSNMKNIFPVLLLTVPFFAWSGADISNPLRVSVDHSETSQTMSAVDISIAGTNETEKDTINQILKDPNFVEKFKLMHESLTQKWNEFSGQMLSRASKEVDRYNASFLFGLEGNQIKLLGSNVADIELNILKMPIQANAYYKFEAKPSFHDGKQLRKDIYVIGLNGSSFISAGTEIRITFFREFDTKFESVFSELPYWFDQIPRSASEMSKLKVQEGVRLEIIGKVSVSKNVSNLLSSTTLSAAIGYDLFQGLFMLDIFKYTPNEVRARFMGTIDHGSLNAGAALNGLTGFKVMNLIPKWFKRYTDFGLTANVTKSFSFFDKYPIESHVVDYFFRFKSEKDASPISAKCAQSGEGEFEVSSQDQSPPTSEQAFDQILNSVKSGKFVSLFNPNLRETAFSVALLKNAVIAEKLACQDRALPAERRRVLHFFQGRIASDGYSINFGPKLGRIAGIENSVGGSESFISSTNEKKEFDYFLLLNSTGKYTNHFLFGRSENEYTTDLDALYRSDKDKNVLTFLNFYQHLRYKQKNMSASDLKDIYSEVARSIPSQFPYRGDVLNLIPKSDQRNSLISIVYSLSQQAIVDLDKMEKGELFQKLSNFFENHPKKHLMNLPRGLGDGESKSFNEYVVEVYNMLNKLSWKAAEDISNLPLEERTQIGRERYVALKELLGTPVFTEFLFKEFLPQLIHQDDATKAMSVQLNVQSDAIPRFEESFGDNQYSSIYDAVLLLRTIINDRSLDLRLESTTGQNNSLNVSPIAMKGFKLY